jgi:hypothetical protein
MALEGKKRCVFRYVGKAPRPSGRGCIRMDVAGQIKGERRSAGPTVVLGFDDAAFQFFSVSVA